MKGLQLKWSNEGWTLDVPRYLTPNQLANVVNYAVKAQTDRWRSLPHGDRRDALELAIELLKKGAIKQRLLPNSSGEYVMLEARR